MKNNIIIIVLGLMFYGCSKRYPDLGNGFKIIGEGGYTSAIVDSQNNQMISEYILDYSDDSTFIIVAQSPPDSLPKMKIFYYSDNNRKKITNNKTVYKQAGELLLQLKAYVQQNENLQYKLYNSGVTGTSICAAFGFEIVKWLRRNRPAEIKFNSFEKLSTFWIKKMYIIEISGFRIFTNSIKSKNQYAYFISGK